jgi:hypothetical protein
MKKVQLFIAALLICGAVNAQDSTKKVFELKGCFPTWKHGNM